MFDESNNNKNSLDNKHQKYLSNADYHGELQKNRIPKNSVIWFIYKILKCFNASIIISSISLVHLGWRESSSFGLL